MKRTRYSKVLQRGLMLTVVLVLTILPNSMGSAARASRAPLESADQIAFVSNRDGNSEIYLMNMDETGLVRLTTNAATDEGPTWSPDGNRIAFHSNRVGYNQIFTMNADGSNQTRLISSAVIDEWPYWSPRGNKIAFARVADHNGDGLRSEVFIANSDGTDVRRLTYSSGSTNGYNTGGWPSGWSPDGSQLIFYWYREGYDQLWIMNSDGTNQRKLTTDSYWNAMPSMAPDGRKVAFASYRDGNYEIYTVNSDGTNATRLTNQAAEEWRPIWSQDGSKIIFESRRTGKTQIYSMSVDGSQQTRITSSNSYDGQQAWRPMGSGASYTITGRVTDTSGSSIPGVTVWAGFPRNTTTDANGNYTFTGLPAGTYTIRPEKEPCTFAPATQTVTVPPGKTLPDFRSARLESGLDICALEPGDILLKAGAPVGDYTDLIRFWIKLGGSYFTHSALYLGVTSDPQNPAQTGPRIAEAAGKKKLGGSREDEVWETWLADTQWWDGENVTDWAVVRPVASSEAKTTAIQYARAKAADPNVVFSFLTDLDDEQEFYCSKLVWKSYQRAGLDVHKKTGLTGDLTSNWVTPEDLYFGSPVVQNMPGVDPSTRAFFRIYSPAHITLIDSLGRRTGFDSTSGGEVNEIPGALYSGVDAQIESISVAGLGSPIGWRLQATGYAAGTYTLETGYLDGRTRNWETHATTSEGKVDEYPVRRPNYPGYLPLLSR